MGVLGYMVGSLGYMMGVFSYMVESVGLHGGCGVTWLSVGLYDVKV